MVEKKGSKKPAARSTPVRAKAKATEKSAKAASPEKKKKKASGTPAPAAARPPRRERAAAPAAADTRPAALGIHDLRPSPGATHYKKRLGRGPGSGHGKTAGRGNKGPKRGFTNIFRVEYDIVNLSDLDRFEAGQAVNPETLAGLRLARKNRRIKILGDGDIGKALTISAHKFSASAQAKIEAAGGRCEVISN